MRRPVRRQPRRALVSESKSRPPRRPATRAVHGPSPHPDGAFSTPILHSSVFAFPDAPPEQEARGRGAAGAFYQRLGHPTLHACEEHFAALAEAERALVFPSG